MWTLEYNGAEKSFGAWKLSQGRLQFQSLKADVFTVHQTVESIEDGPSFPFEGKVLVRVGRKRATPTAPFTGGYVIFVGYRLEAAARGSGSEQGFDYTFAGPFYLLEDLMYRQQWFSGVTTHVLLGINAAGQYIRSGAQLADALNYGLTQGVDLQPGAIEAGLYVPIEEKTDAPCADVIRQCARWSPDAISYVDYTTTPPTLHFRRRGDLPLLELPVPKGRTTGTTVTPRYDLKRDYCLLLFEQSVDVGGEQKLKIFPQVAPAGHPGTGRRGFVSTINLQGPRISVTEAEVATAPFDPDNDEYWKLRTPALQNGKWRNATIEFLGAKDGQFADVDVDDYEFELVDGSLNDQMTLDDGTPVEWIEVKLHYRVTCDHYDSPVGGTRLGRITQDMFLEKTLTNAPSGTYRYGGEDDPGDPLPNFSGMAQYLLTATNELQFDGQHTFCDVTTKVRGLGFVLGLLDSDPAWATMRALVTQVSIDCTTQNVTLRYGPAPHLEKGDLLDLTKNNRQRRNNTSKKARTEGASTSANATNLGQTTPDTTAHQQTPEYRELVIRDPDTGNSVTITPNLIEMKTADGKSVLQLGLGGNGQKIYILGNDLTKDVTARFNGTGTCNGTAKVTKNFLREV